MYEDSNDTQGKQFFRKLPDAIGGRGASSCRTDCIDAKTVVFLRRRLGSVGDPPFDEQILYNQISTF
jgi:hypothetical protein